MSHFTANLATLRRNLIEKRVTLLGVGPVSKLVTDVAIRFANFYQFPIALIPSRRQVDSTNAGGGYVENWSTESFVRYVRSQDAGGFVLLSRDHAGPWQGTVNVKYGFGNAHELNPLRDAKESLSEDIRVGFDLLHIDPSMALNHGFSESDVEDMTLDLMTHCLSEAGKKCPVAFEVGTDEQSFRPEPLAETQRKFTSLISKLKSNGLPSPMFYVVQTGTKVVESRNEGSFDSLITSRGDLPPAVHLPYVLQFCNQQGVMLKEHNADYLSDRALSWHRRFGIHAANVAPEFGVTETRAFLEILFELQMNTESETFMELVLEGGKWKKWMKSGSTATDLERVQIAGHYHFADPMVREIRQKALRLSRKRNYDSEKFIVSRVSVSINRYLMAFGYGRHP